jgi:hypothetical protein
MCGGMLVEGDRVEFVMGTIVIGQAASSLRTEGAIGRGAQRSDQMTKNITAIRTVLHASASEITYPLSLIGSPKAAAVGQAVAPPGRPRAGRALGKSKHRGQGSDHRARHFAGKAKRACVIRRQRKGISMVPRSLCHTLQTGFGQMSHVSHTLKKAIGPRCGGDGLQHHDPDGGMAKGEIDLQRF